MSRPVRTANPPAVAVSSPAAPGTSAHRAARRLRSTVALLALVLGSGMSACTEAADGPTGPAVPSVAGTWVGSWRGTDVRLSLSQSGASVNGQLRVGPANYVVTGTVTPEGVLQWASDVLEANCTAVASPAMQLQSQGNSLEGTMRRSQLPRPCGSTGRSSVMQGLAELERAF